MLEEEDLKQKELLINIYHSLSNTPNLIPRRSFPGMMTIDSANLYVVRAVRSIISAPTLLGSTGMNRTAAAGYQQSFDEAML